MSTSSAFSKQIASTFSKLQCLVFDWEGTLFNYQQGLIQTVREVGKHLGCIVLLKDYEIIQIFKEKGPRYIEDLFGDNVDVFAAEQRLEHSLKKVSRGCLFDGALELIADLQQRGVLCVIATGTSLRAMNHIFKHYALADVFDGLYTADRYERKPNPAMLEAISEDFGIPFSKMMMVGDSECDLAMAARVGVASVGVLSGADHCYLLAKCKPIALLHSVGVFKSFLAA